MKSLSLVAAAACAAALVTAPASAADLTQSNLAPAERGAALVAFGGCNDCHTPLAMGPEGPAPDMKRMLSGHPQEMVMPPAPPLPPGPWMYVVGATNTAWSGPWGVSFTANLTPDPETGLGKWSEADFIATIRSGRHLGRGRQILPPMPIWTLQSLTDGDLKAVFAYLKTIPAIRNKVPDPLPPAAAPPAK
jgi:mono/diheme cytochrome c family protein